MNQLKLKIFGKVQGVFFRVELCKFAKELGIFGWIKNVSDGTVEILAEGSTKDLKKLVKWCRVGPSLSHVDRVEEKWEKIEKCQFSKFIILE